MDKEIEQLKRRIKKLKLFNIILIVYVVISLFIMVYNQLKG
ncbi:hypothetical protein C900_05444 [Fulvivirga imtechensis AK7]|uniref:Uncharacterized protein n=1 Tax=Fulvivirga imtechensis AK7 TaxID=1237149 RepID=L8JJS3_9BACT|nr:hypothetical protein [Fulvivirga imtechensis]ELR69055.1 hypothetical protein C900_05444 [Fulvivirga imtechensis AK7]